MFEFKDHKTQDEGVLLVELERVFGSLKLPEAKRIVYDPSGCHLECLQVMETFGGRTWQSFSIDELQYEADALVFFSPEGFRYYLPAFVQVSVLHLDQSDLIPETIVSCLRPRSDPDFQALNLARLQSLNAAQRRVLIDFCRFLAKQPEEVMPAEELQACERELARGLS